MKETILSRSKTAISEYVLKDRLFLSLECYDHKNSSSYLNMKSEVAENVNSLGLYHHYISNKQHIALTCHEDALLIFLKIAETSSSFYHEEKESEEYLYLQIAETLADIGNVYSKLNCLQYCTSFYLVSLWVWNNLCHVTREYHRKMSVVRKLYLFTRDATSQKIDDISQILLPLHNLQSTKCMKCFSMHSLQVFHQDHINDCLSSRDKGTKNDSMGSSPVCLLISAESLLARTNKNR